MTYLSVGPLRAEARKLGLSFGEIANILTKWGPAVLRLVIDGLRNGLTLSFIKEVLATLGPLFLQSAIENMHYTNQRVKHLERVQSVLQAPTKEEWATFEQCCNDKPCETQCVLEECPHFDKPKLTTAVPILEGEQVESFDQSNVFVDLIIKLLPDLLNKYGQQILQWLLDIVIKSLQDRTQRQRVTAAVQDALARM